MKIFYIKIKSINHQMIQFESVSKILLGCLLALFITSCESFVEVDPPRSELISETVFEEAATANAAVLSIYIQLRDNVLITGSSTGVSVSMGLYADELDFFPITGSLLPFANNMLIPTDGTIASIWNNSYNLIFQANAIIEGVDNSIALSLEDKNQIKGEALFLRACIHFYLVNLFGDVPYITTSDFKVNTEVSRTPEQEVYTQLISDLEEAKSLLPEEYLTGERIRANKGVASALLSRVYLYAEDYANAATESTAVIGKYIWENDLDKVFLKESGSTIWQFKPETEGLNTGEANLFIFITGPPPSVALNGGLIGAFELGDVRRGNWVKEVTDGTDSWYHAFKYKERGDTETSVEYSILLRLAEQYLIRAEARVQQGDIAGAQADLNRVRNRAGLGNTPAATTPDLLEAILQERRVELFTEQGHRFFDLKRMGKANEVLGPVKPGWEATDVLLPIPEVELLVNPNLLPQNPGYN
ncbi:RagB/SusD family nutrient uptake outer membrane protein [uncultured Polaribacter sp.]|uniref:RagB/SusD family nutrient uptake outer membrane protein n=1 Tax=uncultured Polaribacter sp. TaxID=174711 RepID=UPI002614BDEA|nr:RagB/SusD family nutrient uptake outer membrane protein [uncultured Polaribacter sp.]